MFLIFIVVLVVVGISLYMLRIEKENLNIKNIHKTIYENQYRKKELMTKEEKYFYNLLKIFKNEYEIMPQVNLATVIQKIDNHKYQTELFRNIDFGIFSKDYNELLLLIEINDQTHNIKQRKNRDKKVKAICQISDIKLITFYTNYPNKPDYVINRVKSELEKVRNLRKDEQLDKLIDDIISSTKLDNSQN